MLINAAIALEGAGLGDDRIGRLPGGPAGCQQAFM